jgi:hypothetical protein
MRRVTVRVPAKQFADLQASGYGPTKFIREALKELLEYFEREQADGRIGNRNPKPKL